MSINLIAAIDRNNLLGINGHLPWKLKDHREDILNFAKLTTGHGIMMGRNTFISMGSKPLAGRENFVLSREYPYNYFREGVWWTGNPIEIIYEHKDKNKELFIIGGGEVYKSLAAFVERMYITVIDQITPLTGTSATFFPWPEFRGHWNCIQQNKLGDDFFYIYDRCTTCLNITMINMFVLDCM